ncbi:VanZ family protein [Listeria weihenstephanensis FSL R9-0317]|uniref:Membrane protein n=1 Tax=Listeria weihenstephanensis TaxID=1006155 RepID=A0A1S7FWH4_9LIST|nr:VanZ family protein [Listeria weihenstephanensis]AQY51788.1 membrane protein [Listeria weihenstephanensis]EUJ41185.1 VanZ family protein [Listeria weihenstephanensis FSL R9-0317]
MQRRLSWLFIGLALVIIVTLFISSSQTYEQQSLVSNLDKILANKPFEKQLSAISFHYAGSEISIAAKGYSSFVEFFIRKGAHFFSYAVLGFSLFVGLGAWLKKSWLILTLSAGIPLAYAALDEFHQMLTGGRTPLVQDVMLDFTGALFGILIGYVIIKRVNKSAA